MMNLHSVVKLFLLILFVLCNAAGYAQYNLKGWIKDEATKQPLPSASVFLSNTQVGVITGKDGSFQLLVPQGKFDMVISSVGYETKVIALTHAYKDSVLHIFMQQKIADLGNVTIESYDKDGWNKWGEIFLNYFFGTSAFAQQCTLQNHEVIHFISNRNNRTLKAIADEPLVIINKSLGYRLQYQLEEFIVDNNNKTLLFKGYPFFTQLTGNIRQQQLWKQNRADAYDGSQIQFMRALYRNEFNTIGFTIKKNILVSDTEKQKIKTLLRTHKARRDSSNYYRFILMQPDEESALLSTLVKADSIAYAIDSVTARLDFNDSLSIYYTKKKNLNDYQNGQLIKSNLLISQINIKDQSVPVIIQSDGMFYPPENLISSGYWAWSERIARLLPFDYWP